MPAATLECEAPQERDQAVHRAAELLRRGGVVVFPTETVYGIGASAASERGVQRLREIKQRQDDKPFSVHIGDPGEVERYIDLDASPMLRLLVRKTMPGPVTLVVEVADDVVERKLAELNLQPDARGRLYHHNTIGLRCPDHGVAQAMLRAAGEPILASSANPAGLPPPTDAQRAAEAVGDRVDLILDGGTSRFARASTIINVRGPQVQIIREGVLDERYLKKLLQTTILFVCSGNTCRSPMAEAIARHELSQRLGVDPDKLHEANVEVASAGAYAFGGAPVTPESIEALRQLGIPLPHRTARPLTTSMIQQADAIYCMTDTHRLAVREMWPSAEGKTRLLDPGGTIEDPIGAGLEVYIQCATRIRDLIRRGLDELGFTGSGTGPTRP